MIIKDPDAKRTYFINWAAWLGTDTLASVVWDVPTGLTKIGQTNTSKIAYVKLGDGEVGKAYRINCHIVTAAGEEEDQSLLIRVEEK